MIVKTIMKIMTRILVVMIMMAVIITNSNNKQK